jgi:hypothetical protein
MILATTTVEDLDRFVAGHKSRPQVTELVGRFDA